eukprot:scaffold5846_cov333-Prasinococcus_capsulatus_cf.AAC.5
MPRGAALRSRALLRPGLRGTPGAGPPWADAGRVRVSHATGEGRDALPFAAGTAQAPTRAEREERLQGLLQRMGLAACADTKCGNALLRGLSGGQKRRLSLAVAIVKVRCSTDRPQRPRR